MTKKLAQTKKEQRMDAAMMRMIEFNRTYSGPKSLCICGCTGDGTNSLHEDTFQPGHGRCTVPGHICMKFSWKQFLPEFIAAVKEAGAKDY